MIERNVTNEDYERIISRYGVAPAQTSIRELLTEDKEMPLTREEVIERVDAFFDSCTETIINENGATERVWRKKPTKGDLCLFLGIDLKTLQRYSAGRYERGEYKEDRPRARISVKDQEIVRVALAKIEAFYESQLLSYPAGSIFWLKNSRNDKWLDDASLRLVNDRIEADGKENDVKTLEEIAQQFKTTELPPPVDLD